MPDDEAAKDSANSTEAAHRQPPPVGQPPAGDAAPGDDVELTAEEADALRAEADTSARTGPVWQIPLLAASVLMLAAGLYMSVRTAPGPDFDGALDAVEHYLEIGDYDKWEQALNDLAPHLPKAEKDRHLARYFFLKGDGLHQLQRAQGESFDTYNQMLIDAYERASEEFGGSLGGARHANLADAYLAVGRDQQAIKLADGLPETHAHRRHAIYRRLIERRLGGEHPDYAGAVQLIERLLKDPTLPTELRVWAYGKRAHALLDQGYAEQALANLLRDIQRAEGEGSQHVGELLSLLGQAYIEFGDYASAAKHLQRAEERLDRHDEAYAWTLVYLARLEQADKNHIDARDTFATIMQEYGGSAAYDAALLGRAETNAALGLYDEALGDYRELISRRQQAFAPGRDLTRQDVLDSLLTEHRKRLIEEDYERALDLAELAQQLYRGEPAPPDVLLVVADSHRALAEHLLAEATDGSEDPDRLLLVDAPTRRRIRLHYSLAGDGYVEHARRMTLENNLAYGESLWQAANAYDKAGDHTEAIDAFQEYLQSRDRDVREPAVRYRLGRLYQARGEYKKAREYFEELISGDDRTTQEARASYVPLARCLLRIDAEKNREAAERALLYVLEGAELDPAAPEFRQALIELGLMYYRSGDYPRAIERLEEAIARYGDSPRILELKFKLAESCRLEAARIAESLELAMRQSERLRLEETRANRLTRAGELYTEVREKLAQRDPRRLSDLEQAMLRESYFYKADCLYYLGDYQEAIKEYNIAIGHYGAHPASLFASVQKVNAYVALERYKDARTAHESARLRLEALPDEAFQTAQLNLMTRQQWEDWLDSIMLIEERTQANVETSE